MALDFFAQEALRQSIVDPNDASPNAAVELIERLDRIQDALDALVVGVADVDAVLTALQTE